MRVALTMNGQIVLCKGINDGEELERSIRDLMKYAPQLQSVSVVPVGLSKYRDGLYPLLPFTKEDAKEVLAHYPQMAEESIRRIRNPLYPREEMSGIFWQRKSFRKKSVTMDICSWKMVWECSASL